jgi:hypothetical protein
MQKHTKRFEAQNCPDCGGILNVETDCSPDDDTDVEIFFNDGDKVTCQNCDFETVITVSDFREAGIVY